MSRTLTYADLPPARPDRDLPGGGRVIAHQPVLLCRACGEAYSADPGDYWNCPKAAPIVCGECDEPMVLAEVRREVFVPYGRGGELGKILAGMWGAE